MTKITAPLGSWKSPITSDLIVVGTIGLGSVTFDGEDIYWLEGRPAEKGCNVLVRYTIDGTITNITLQPYNVHTRVHEYGGGSYLIVNKTIYFINFTDQQIYQQLLNYEPQPLTSESQKHYADLTLDEQRNRLICVCEDHSNPDREPREYFSEY